MFRTCLSARGNFILRTNYGRVRLQAFISPRVNPSRDRAALRASTVTGHACFLRFTRFTRSANARGMRDRRRANPYTRVCRSDLQWVCICLTRCSRVCNYRIPRNTTHLDYIMRVIRTRVRRCACVHACMCKYPGKCSHVAGFISRWTISEIFMWLARHAIVRSDA